MSFFAGNLKGRPLVSMTKDVRETANMGDITLNTIWSSDMPYIAVIESYTTSVDATIGNIRRFPIPDRARYMINQGYVVVPILVFEDGGRSVLPIGRQSTACFCSELSKYNYLYTPFRWQGGYETKWVCEQVYECGYKPVYECWTEQKWECRWVGGQQVCQYWPVEVCGYRDKWVCEWVEKCGWKQVWNDKLYPINGSEVFYLATSATIYMQTSGGTSISYGFGSSDVKTAIGALGGTADTNLAWVFPLLSESANPPMDYNRLSEEAWQKLRNMTNSSFGADSFGMGGGYVDKSWVAGHQWGSVDSHFYVMDYNTPTPTNGDRGGWEIKWEEPRQETFYGDIKATVTNRFGNRSGGDFGGYGLSPANYQVGVVTSVEWKILNLKYTGSSYEYIPVVNPSNGGVKISKNDFTIGGVNFLDSTMEFLYQRYSVPGNLDGITRVGVPPVVTSQTASADRLQSNGVVKAYATSYAHIGPSAGSLPNQQGHTQIISFQNMNRFKGKSVRLDSSNLTFGYDNVVVWGKDVPALRFTGNIASFTVPARYAYTNSYEVLGEYDLGLEGDVSTCVISMRNLSVLGDVVIPSYNGNGFPRYGKLLWNTTDASRDGVVHSIVNIPDGTSIPIMTMFVRNEMRKWNSVAPQKRDYVATGSVVYYLRRSGSKLILENRFAGSSGTYTSYEGFNVTIAKLF